MDVRSIPTQAEQGNFVPEKNKTWFEWGMANDLFELPELEFKTTLYQLKNGFLSAHFYLDKKLTTKNLIAIKEAIGSRYGG